MFDTLIKNGTIVDGTGNPGYVGHVGISGDTISVLTGDASAVQAQHLIDASHLTVVPGFVDAHTHSGLIALEDPRNEAKLRQGVTTEIIGVDGLGYAPLTRKNLELMLMRNSGLDGYPNLQYEWDSVTGYLSRFGHQTSANVAFLLPNSCLRVETVGWTSRRASATELAVMKDTIRQTMSEGAVGLSTGLQYPPGSYADTDELVSLCEVVGRCGGIYVTHVRYDLGDRMWDPFREAVLIGLRSGCPVHISHFFATIPLRGRATEMLEFVDAARKQGVDLTFDSYPWPAGSTMLDIVCPQEDYSGGPQHLLERLQNPADRMRMRDQSTHMVGHKGAMVISAVRTDKNKWCEGLTVQQVSDTLQKDAWDTICDLLIEEELAVAFYSFSGDMNDVKVIIRHPAHMFCSDALRIGGHPNPRTYATYPKVLGELVRDEQVMPLEQAICKMTSFPAQRFGLSDRGVLRNGMKADIVVFNPFTVSGVATFDNPCQYPLGIEYVFVNGQPVISGGYHTGAFPGQPLLRQSYPGDGR